MSEQSIEQETSTEEVNEILTAVPPWVLRWGITLIFLVLACILLISTLIKYPDLIKAGLKVNSLNAPKSVLAKQNGKLTALLVAEGQLVTVNQPLAYFESIGHPEDVLELNKRLKEFRAKILAQDNELVVLPDRLQLGELQSSYQNFYDQYLQYRSTLTGGYYNSQLDFLTKDLAYIKALNQQIIKQQNVQLKEYANQVQEYSAYQKLYKNKVISRSEFSQQEIKYLASKYPLQQTETEILKNTGNYSAKEKELMDLRHTIALDKAKFLQALNQCINESDNWILQHILLSPVTGKVSFAGILQQNQNVTVNQELFVVNPGNSNFFGEVHIPQHNMGKIKEGARILVKLHSYPYEQYGIIGGKLTYISDVAYHDSIFVAKVSFEKFENQESGMKIILKNGMQGDAEIITEESSLFRRFFTSIEKILNFIY